MPGSAAFRALARKSRPHEVVLLSRRKLVGSSLLQQQPPNSLVVSPQGRRRVVVAGTAAAAAATGAAAVAACYYSYSNNEQTLLGLRRQARFWRRVFPVVADYYWNFGGSSPYVRYLQWKQQVEQQDDNDSNNEDTYQIDKQRRLEELHERHAPEILQVLLDLRGLYVKLGQVLSVTALPIPQAYRVRFRTLQSDVPGHEEWSVVERVLQQELGTNDLGTVFAAIEPVPEGAASIGQAHRAVLLRQGQDDGQQQEVIVKIQYPDAAWQVPADIQCVGDLLKLCVWAGVVDESAARISFEEFARQFISELDYAAEQRNLRETHQSSLRKGAPYQKRGVVVPRVYEDLSTSKVITMSYLRGRKLEDEARRQLEMLGIDTTKGIGSLVRDAAARDGTPGDELEEEAEMLQKNDNSKNAPSSSSSSSSWKLRWGQRVGRWVGVDTALAAVRLVQRVKLWTTSATASTVRLLPLVPAQWKEWSEQHVTAYQQSQRMDVTQSWIDALFDVHGYQIFQQGLFNADCHPGNILVLEDVNGQPTNQLGLIDYGQCKRLGPSEQVRVAELLLSVANNESDEQIAAAFRRLHVQTKNGDNSPETTHFLAEMARLMFGRFETKHLDHAYHRKLHKMDRIMSVKELSMVYRTALLLRGLAVSLQVNPSVSEQWRTHAQAAVEQHGASLLQKRETRQIVRRASSVDEPSLGGEVAVA